MYNEIVMVMKNIDLKIINYIHDKWRNKFLDKFMVLLTHLGEVGFLWFFSAFVLFIMNEPNQIYINIFLGLIIVIAINEAILKPLVRRPRPNCPVMKDIARMPRSFSFPSSHAATSFVTATIIFQFYQPAGIACMILASLMALSRIYLKVHYPSDIAAGAIIGIIVGILIV